MMKTLEKLSTVAVICVALLFGFVLVKDHLLQGSATTIAVPSQVPQVESSLKGQRITLERVDWNESRFTVILALSTNCHFCTESAPFYRRLAAKKETSANAFRLFTIFPQEIEAAEDYLKQNKVTPDAVFSLKQTNIDVNGTPTLLLVDSQGIVQKVWVGKLTESAEQEVLASL